MRELLNTGVNINLDYSPEHDALMGQVKGYSVAVKENLATGSYGCLFWIKKGSYAPSYSVEEYLTAAQQKNPELIKKFMVNQTGVAVALNRTSDDFSNINNLKRFIFDFAAFLTANYYENCCCECGRTDNLGIYNANGVIAQTCSSCGVKYSFIRNCTEEPVFPPPPAEPVTEEKEEPLPLPVQEETLSEKEETDISSLMFEESAEENTSYTYSNSISADSNEAESFDSLLIGDEKPEPERPRSAIFEQAEREFAAEQARRAQEEAKTDNAMNDLLIDDGNFVLKEIVPEKDNGSYNVTEAYDDSNDGEDFEISEIKTTVEMPTVTTGHPQLTAEETPLEADGSVPLINPTSHREERHVSPVDGPDAVQPLEFGQSRVTHENLNGSVPPPGYSSMGSVDRTAAPPPYNPNMNYSSYTRPVTMSEKSNAFMGIIGALVLGFLGVAIWIFIADIFEVISVWGCLAIFITVNGGYYLAGRALDKKGIIICAILTLLMTFAEVFGMTVMDIMQELNELYGISVNIMQGIEWTIASFDVESVRSAFIENLVFSMAIAFIGAIASAVSLWKRA